MNDLISTLSTNEMLEFEEPDNTKAYSFMFVHYGNPLHLLDNVSNIKHCISILHNKDTKPGSLEKAAPHFHTILTFENARALSAMRKICKSLRLCTGSTFLVKSCHSLAQATSYIFHQTEECLNDPNKYAYVFADAICDNDAYWLKIFNGSREGENQEFVRDLLILKPIQLAYKYGKDYIRNCSRYCDFRDLIYKLYNGDFTDLISDVNTEGNKSNVKEIFNSYYLKGNLNND